MAKGMHAHAVEDPEVKNEEEAFIVAPFMERIKLPLTENKSIKKLKRIQRAYRNG